MVVGSPVGMVSLRISAGGKPPCCSSIALALYLLPVAAIHALLPFEGEKIRSVCMVSNDEGAVWR